MVRTRVITITAMCLALWTPLVIGGEGELPLDRGHRILLERGLQILATTTPFEPYNTSPDDVYWSAFEGSGFTTPYEYY